MGKASLSHFPKLKAPNELKAEIELTSPLLDILLEDSWSNLLLRIEAAEGLAEALSQNSQLAVQVCSMPAALSSLVNLLKCDRLNAVHAAAGVLSTLMEWCPQVAEKSLMEYGLMSLVRE